MRVKRWQHIWLNEGFATYAEWLWSEHEGFDTAQEIADFFYNEIPEDDPFWQLTIGDPGPEALFDFAVYARGALTLQALRVAVGDADFFRILKAWPRWRGGRTGTTDQFIALAEHVSGQQLDELFEAWLFTPGKPSVPPSPGPAAPDRPAGRALGRRTGPVAEASTCAADPRNTVCPGSVVPRRLKAQLKRG